MQPYRAIKGNSQQRDVATTISQNVSTPSLPLQSLALLEFLQGFYVVSVIWRPASRLILSPHISTRTVPEFSTTPSTTFIELAFRTRIRSRMPPSARA